MTIAPATPVSIFVHLTSGDVLQLSPADNVRVNTETVEIRNGEQRVALYTARDVLFCSHADVSPFPCN
jgi:hypothetical protein